MNTTYRKNLKDVATACKNYTDAQIAKSEEKLMWYIGERQTTTQDDNTTAYQKTVPANATRCKIKRIYGLTQKFNPSVANDTTAAFIKTLPDTVYDLDVSCVYGDSKVSENLVNIQNGTITSASVSFVFANGVCNSSGTPSMTGWIRIKAITLPAGTYYYKDFTTGSNPMRIIDSNYNAKTTQPFTLANQETMYLAVTGNSINDYGQLINSKPMLVKGSTAPTEWKQGFSGIHNLELSGLKVEGTNKKDLNYPTMNYRKNNLTDFISPSEGSTNRIRTESFAFEPVPNKTYYINNIPSGISLIQVRCYDSTQTYIGVSSNISGNSFTISLENVKYIHILFGGSNFDSNTKTLFTQIGIFEINSIYADYITPTTKTIDLSTILYNGSPLFEDNSLKAIGTAKDYITPYKAHKGIGYVNLGSLTWNYNSSNKCFYVPNWVSSFVVGKASTTNFLSTLYSYGNIWSSDTTIDFIMQFSNGGYPYIRNLQYNGDSEAFKTAMSGVYLVYEIATPIEVNIDLSSTLRGIQGYSKGTITLQNTHNMNTDNTITYNSIIKEVLNTGVRLDGANRFDKDTYAITNGFSLNDAGEVIANSSSWKVIDYYMSIKENITYTLSGTAIGTANWGTRISFYDENYNQISQIKSSNITTTYTFTTPSGTRYWKYSWAIVSDTSDWILNEGSTALSYRPYKTPQTINFPTQASDAYSAGSVSNVRDFTTNKRGTNVSKNIFTNNEETYTRSVASSLNGYQIVKNNSVWKNGTLNAVEDFDITVGDSYSSEHYSLATNRFNISFNASRGIDTIEKAKQYIGGRIFYYELADASKTETDIDSVDNILVVEEGDILTFLNSENLPVPSDITYRIEVDRV